MIFERQPSRTKVTYICDDNLYSEDRRRSRTFLYWIAHLLRPSTATVMFPSVLFSLLIFFSHQSIRFCWLDGISQKGGLYLMMTSSNGNIFRVTSHLCGEFTVHRWIPAQRPVTRSFDVFFDPRLNKRLNKQWWGWWFETPSRLLWCHCDVIGSFGTLHHDVTTWTHFRFPGPFYGKPPVTDGCPAEKSVYRNLKIVGRVSVEIRYVNSHATLD